MDAPRVARLLKLGADRFLVDKDGWTALHWAAFQGVSAGACVRACSHRMRECVRARVLACDAVAGGWGAWKCLTLAPLQSSRRSWRGCR
jgi:hypothetical protein